MNAPVSDALKAAIEGGELSLRQLAARTGVDAGRLSRFLRGQRELTSGAVDALCVELGLSLRQSKRRGSKRT